MKLKLPLFFLFFAYFLTFLCVDGFCLEGKVNINTATEQQLQNLPYIGKKRAGEIIKYRETNGPFQSTKEIQKSSDIGNSTYEAIRPYISVSGGSNPAVNQIPENQPEPSDHPAIFQFLPHPGEVQLIADSAYFPALVGLIRNAEREIDIAMFLFKTTGSPRNRANKLLQELVLARMRGIDINVLLERSDYDEALNKENNKVASWLKKNNIQVRFDSKNTTTHTKAVIFDGQYVLLGSHNFTHSALGYNHELSVLINSTDIAREIQNYIAAIR